MVQPRGSHWVALGEVPRNVPGLSFWGVKRRWVTGELVPRGPGSCVGRPCRWLSEFVGSTVGSTASGGAMASGEGLP